MSFIHLRVHSAYSLAEGAVKIKDLAKLCSKETMPAVAVTDTCNLFGALEFSVTAAENGIQPIVGAMVMITREDRDPLSPVIPPPDPLVLLVQNELGYRNLLNIVSKAYIDAPAGCPPQISFKILANHTEGLICLTAGVDGVIGRHLLANNPKKAKEILGTLKELFPQRLYVELMRHGLKEEEETEEKLIDFAYELDLPLVATNDVFFSTAS